MLVRILIWSAILFPLITIAETSSKCPGEQGYFFINNYDGNPTIGGFVSNAADVDVTVRISPLAAVCGSSSVLNKARIYGNAVVSGEATVADDARVFGSARIMDHAIVRGTAAISGMAIISGEAVIEGDAVVRGWGRFNEGKQNSGLHAPDTQPEDEVDQQQVELENQQTACVEGLKTQCQNWENCEGLTKGDCARTVIRDFNNELENCHKNNMHTRITFIKEGYYKKYIVIDDKKIICNSEQKITRVKKNIAANALKEGLEGQEESVETAEKLAAANKKWCTGNTPLIVASRADKCVNTCERMTGFTKTPRAYYDACMGICAKNKKIRLRRFDKRCEAEL